MWVNWQNVQCWVEELVECQKCCMDQFECECFIFLQLSWVWGGMVVILCGFLDVCQIFILLGVLSYFVEDFVVCCVIEFVVMEVVMVVECVLGNEFIDVLVQKIGYDIVLYDFCVGYLCFIEVKGWIDGVDMVMLIWQEIIILLYELGKYILVIVQIDSGFVCELCYVCGVLLDYEFVFEYIVIQFNLKCLLEWVEVFV